MNTAESDFLLLDLHLERSLQVVLITIHLVFILRILRLTLLVHCLKVGLYHLLSSVLTEYLGLTCLFLILKFLNQGLSFFCIRLLLYILNEVFNLLFTVLELSVLASNSCIINTLSTLHSEVIEH
jgi:hypothetical protein